MDNDRVLQNFPAKTLAFRPFSTTFPARCAGFKHYREALQLGDYQRLCGRFHQRCFRQRQQFLIHEDRPEPEHHILFPGVGSKHRRLGKRHGDLFPHAGRPGLHCAYYTQFYPSRAK